MIAIAILIGGLLGGIETLSGYQATHSFWSFGATIPLAVITGIIAGKIAAKL